MQNHANTPYPSTPELGNASSLAKSFKQALTTEPPAPPSWMLGPQARWDRAPSARAADAAPERTLRASKMLFAKALPFRLLLVLRLAEFTQSLYSVWGLRGLVPARHACAAGSPGGSAALAVVGSTSSNVTVTTVPAVPPLKSRNHVCLQFKALEDPYVGHVGPSRPAMRDSPPSGRHRVISTSCYFWFNSTAGRMVFRAWPPPEILVFAPPEILLPLQLYAGTRAPMCSSQNRAPQQGVAHMLDHVGLRGRCCLGCRASTS